MSIARAKTTTKLITAFQRTSDSVFYVGKAPPGTATSAAKWQIARFTDSGTEALPDLKEDLADGNALFDNVWDNAASLSYS